MPDDVIEEAEGKKTEPVPDPPPEGIKTTPDGKIQVLHPSVFKRLKDEAREKGGKQALLDLAKANGFSTVEEMQTALAASRAQPKKEDRNVDKNKKPNGNGNNGRRDPGPAPQNLNPRAAQAWERERLKIQTELAAAKKASAVSDRRARLLRKELEDTKLDAALGKMATRVGIREVDFAVELVKRHVDQLSEEDTEKFNEAAIEQFFTGLREPRPYLFGEVTKAVTTGTNGGTQEKGAPNPPKTAEVNDKNKAEPIDARKMTQPEFQALVRKKGFSSTL